MSAIQRVGAGQVRVLVAIVLATVSVAAAHVALERAITGVWDWTVIGVDAGTALLVVAIAIVYLRSVARERRREVVEHMLLGLLATPRNIRDTAEATLRALEEYGIGDASLVAIVEDGDEPLRPMLTRGYPRAWRESASPLRRDGLRGRPALDRPKEPHPWAEPVANAGKRPWVAQLPLVSGDQPLGLLMIIARRPGVLRDPTVLELLSTRLGAAFDHAALYEAADARERSLEELEVRRREFMAALAHEIRTPLTSIQAFADLLQMGEADLDEAASSLVSSLGQGVRRLSSLVDDLIDLGRSGDSDFPIESTTIDLGEAIRTAEATLRPAVILRNQTMAIEVPEHGPLVLCDRRVVQQVVLNLLSNASRHSPPGGHITVTAQRLDHATVRFEVSDTGPGIPEDDLERIFQPYYRVQREGVSVPGSGLGLTVARRLLGRAGGRVWATAAEGGSGARLCVEFRAA